MLSRNMNAPPASNACREENRIIVASLSCASRVRLGRPLLAGKRTHRTGASGERGAGCADRKLYGERSSLAQAIHQVAEHEGSARNSELVHGGRKAGPFRAAAQIGADDRRDSRRSEKAG